jgi:hypothetical protein
MGGALGASARAGRAGAAAQGDVLGVRGRCAPGGVPDRPRTGAGVQACGSLLGAGAAGPTRRGAGAGCAGLAGGACIERAQFARGEGAVRSDRAVLMALACVRGACGVEWRGRLGAPRRLRDMALRARADTSSGACLESGRSNAAAGPGREPAGSEQQPACSAKARELCEGWVNRPFTHCWRPEAWRPPPPPPLPLRLPASGRGGAVLGAPAPTPFCCRLSSRRIGEQR